MWDGAKDVEVDVLSDGKTYTYTISRCVTEVQAIERAIKMHGSPGEWVGNVRVNTPIRHGGRK